MIAYIIRNTVNGKGYVGISKEPSRRWKKHLCAANSEKSGAILYKAIKKYGAENFAIETVACARTWVDLQALERLLIRQHKTFYIDGTGYNMTLGGEGALGHVVSRETKERTRSSLVGRKHSAERIANIRAAVAGKGHRGRKLSAEQIRRFTEVAKRPKTPEHKAKLRAANLGRKLSLDCRAKISAALSGRGPSAEELARRQSPEFREKQRLARLGKRQSPDAVKKTRAANLGRLHTQEAKAKMSAARRGCAGKKQSPETIARKIAAQTGKRRSAEARARISAGCIGRSVSEQARAKISAALKGRKISEEHRKKIGAYSRGRVDSPETRARKSAAARLREAARRIVRVDVSADSLLVEDAA